MKGESTYCIYSEQSMPKNGYSSKILEKKYAKMNNYLEDILKKNNKIKSIKCIDILNNYPFNLFCSGNH